MDIRLERDEVALDEVYGMVRHFTGKNPEELTEEQFFRAFRDYSFLRRREMLDQETIQLNALLRFWNMINKK